MSLPDDVLSQQIDESINQFIAQTKRVQEIKSETSFVYETAYRLTSGKSVYVGLSAARDFLPSVRLSSRLGIDVSLSVSEFCELARRAHLLESHLQKKVRFEEKEEKFDSVAVLLTSYNGKSVVKIKTNGTSFDLDKVTFQQLSKQLNLIFYRIQLLQHLDFRKFYKECLHSATNFVGGELSENLKTLCSGIKNSESVYCLREVVLNHSDKLEADFNLIKLYAE